MKSEFSLSDVIDRLEELRVALNESMSAMQFGFSSAEEREEKQFGHVNSRIDALTNEMRESNLRTNRLEVQAEITSDTLTDHEHRIGKLEDRKLRPL
jgi:hypothetical protein